MNSARRKEPNTAIAHCVVSDAVARKIRRALLTWYLRHGRSFPWRRKRATLYQSVLAEVLLQRTQAATVARFFQTFLERYPSWQAIAEAEIDEIGSLLRPIGLWRRRAASLSALAKAMAAKNGRFPSTRSEIEALPGVGQYIANSILMFAHRQPEPLLDVNMARVIERLFGPRKLVDIRFDPGLQAASRVIVRGKNAVELNWAILDLAATVCTTSKPACIECPLLRFCRFGLAQSKQSRKFLK